MVCPVVPYRMSDGTEVVLADMLTHELLSEITILSDTSEHADTIRVLSAELASRCPVEITE